MDRIPAELDHAELHEAAHLGAQSLGRAANATDSLVQNALYDLRVHGGEYAHLPEKELRRTHEAMKYVSIGSSIADNAARSDGEHLLQNLFTDPSGLPALLMIPLLHRGAAQ
jgi:hypothetical protein